MSQDKLRPLLKAVADLPSQYTGLMLDAANKLRGPRGNEIAERIQNALKPFVESVSLNITVPPSLTTLERIALGAYDWKNSNITNELFPHDPTTVGEWEYDLYHSNCNISSEDGKRHAEQGGWVVGTAEHLLALGQKFPNLQRGFPIVALGSVCEVDGDRRVLGLWGDGGERNVNLYYWGDEWNSHCRFLRVRKVSGT